MIRAHPSSNASLEARIYDAGGKLADAVTVSLEARHPDGSTLWAGVFDWWEKGVYRITWDAPPQPVNAAVALTITAKRTAMETDRVTIPVLLEESG